MNWAGQLEKCVAATRPLPAIEGKGTGYKTCRPMGALEPLGLASCHGQGYVQRYPRRPSEIPRP